MVTGRLEERFGGNSDHATRSVRPRMSAPAELDRPPDLQQRRLAKLVETMHDGLLLLDERGTISLANAAASRLLDVADPTSLDWSGLLATLHHKLALDDSRVRRCYRTRSNCAYANRWAKRNAMLSSNATRTSC